MENIISAREQGGQVLLQCLGMSNVFVNARADEMVARDGGAVQPNPGLTRAEVAFYDGKRLLGCAKLHQ